MQYIVISNVLNETRLLYTIQRVRGKQVLVNEAFNMTFSAPAKYLAEFNEAFLSSTFISLTRVWICAVQTGFNGSYMSDISIIMR